MARKKKIEKSPVYKRWWFWTAIVAVVAAIVATLVFVVAPNLSQQGEPAKTPQSIIRAEGKIGSENAVVQLSDDLILAATTDYHRPYTVYTKSWQTPDTDMEYVAVCVGLINASDDKEISYDSSWFALLNKSDEEIPDAYNYTFLFEGEDYLDKGVLRPGETAIGYLVFSVKKTQKMSDLELNYIDLENSSKFAIFDF